MNDKRITLARLSVIVAGVIGALALVAAGAFVFVKLKDAFQNDPAERSARSLPSAVGNSSDPPVVGSATSVGVVVSSAPSASLAPTTASATDSPTASSSATVSTSGPPSPSATASPATATTTAPRSTSAIAPDTPTTAVSGGATYPTLPDGTPVPILAIFDADRVTVGGAVPSQAAKDLLTTLAVANSKNPNVIVENLVTIDPTVPAGIGVRVIELTSVRFPSGSADILPEHALELDRIANVMKALPNITTLVIGHSDQLGSELANFELSEARARSVVTYMVGAGIAPARLASRGVGEFDLLSINDDATSLALNRRTEFVISGLLVDA